MSEAEETPPPSKPKRKLGKVLMIAAGALVLAGGGAGAGLYAAGSGLGGGGDSPDSDAPHLVPKSEQKRGASAAESGDHGGEEAAAGAGHGKPTPKGKGGERYASNYYALEKEFTSNLQDSVHMVQVGVAIATPYDDTVIENIKTNEIAVRSAILMALGDTTEDEVFTSPGKKQLQRRLAGAINDTLKEKEGFGGVGNVYFTNFVVQ